VPELIADNEEGGIMRCEQVVIELDGYVKGELDWETTRQIERHLTQCLACAAELRILSRENAAYAAYRSNVRLSEDTWKKVQMRMAHLGTEARQIRAPRVRGLRLLSRINSRAWSTWAAAACLVTALGFSLYYYERASRAPGGVEITEGITHGVSPPPKDENESFRNPKPATRVFRRTAEAKAALDRAVTELDDAVALLNRVYDERKANLDPRTIGELDRNLKIIDATIAECQQALQAHPDNLQTAEFLLRAYEKKVDILKRITEEL